MNRLITALHKGEFRGVISPIHKKRRLIQLKGKDTLKFLNEVSTQKTLEVGKSGYVGDRSTGVAFLSPEGKVLFDNILYHRNESNSFFIETENEQVQDLFNHMRKYRGKSGVFFNEEEANDYNIWALLATRMEHHDHFEKYFKNDSRQSKLLCYQDPRWPIALRLLVPKDQTVSDFLPKGDNTIYNDIDGKLYQWLRTVNGISEGTKEIVPNVAKPLNTNLDVFNAVSLEGNYIGSSSMNHVKKTGIVRRRHIPFITIGKFKDINTMDYNALVTHVKSQPDRLVPEGLVYENGDISPIFDLKTTPPPIDTVLFPVIKTEDNRWSYEVDEEELRPTTIVRSCLNGTLALTELVDLDTAEDVGGLFVTEKKENEEQILMKAIQPVWGEEIALKDEEYDYIEDIEEGDYDKMALIQIMGEYGPTFEQDIMNELSNVENKLFSTDFGEFEGESAEDYKGLKGEFEYLF